MANEDLKVIWMHCRARTDNQIDSQKVCKGNEAYVIFTTRMAPDQGGGSITRYRCMTCKGTWFIRL